MKIKKLAVLLTAAALTASAVAGCSGAKETAAVASGAGAGTAAETTAAENTAEESGKEEAADAMAQEDEENYDTGDASKDNTRNQDGIGEDELLVVSFGTSYNDNRRLTVGAIEDAMEKAFPDYSVRRGFTSQIIIDHVKSRDNVAIDNVGEALERAEKNGVRNLVIQPTHLMDGLEYTDLVNEVAGYSDAFGKVAIGKPLLTTDDDFKAVMKAVTEATAEYDDGETAICFMGHGTEADSNHVYAKMEDMLADGYIEEWICYKCETVSAKRLTILPGRSVTIKDNAPYGLICLEGHGTFGKWEIESPALIRYGELTHDEYFVTEQAAKEGVVITNPSLTDPIVILKHFSDNPDLIIQ